MSNIKTREKALELRKQEYSYSQIKATLNVSKSTLSTWLRDYPLSRERISQLRDKNEKRIERYRETMRRKKQTRLDSIYETQKHTLLPLTSKEIFMAGIFLYLGEGTKATTSHVTVTNTDPTIIKIFIHFLVKICKVSKNEIRAHLHLYNNMNIEKEHEWWVETLNFKREQFQKPYIKNSSSDRINHRGTFGHGTCKVGINNTRLFEKIMMSIKVVTDRLLKT